jgi:DNA-binding SARP family transcriptional activator
MQCRVLGPLEMSDASGEPLDLGGQKQRALLGLLICAGGRVVSAARLVDELWGEAATTKAPASVHSYIANLRRALEPARSSRSAPTVLVTRPPGYALVLPLGSLDAATFERLTSTAREQVATDPQRARTRLEDALALWRGDAYADVASAASGLSVEAARLDELRLTATEDRWRTRLALGDHAAVAGEIESLLAAHPLREQAWALLALALYRSQRQGDALAALRRARTILADELGLDPGPDLRHLERAILGQDRTLDGTPAAIDGGTALPAAATTMTGPRTPRDGIDRAPLVGREQVLARLAGCLVDAAAGRGRLVLVTGEPGIGKTALSQALTATAEAMGLRTGWGRCEEPGGAPALWPWSQALTQALARVDLRALSGRDPRLSPASPLLPALAPRAPDGSVHGVGAPDVDTAAFRLAEAVAALLGDTVGPSMLVLDDVHWADVDTLGLLRRLGPRLASLPVVVLVTSRDAESEITPALADVLGELARLDPLRERLTGLSPADVSDYLRARQGHEVPGDVAQALHDRTDGNPFYLGELVRMLAGEGLLEDARAASELHVPDGVRDVVRRRLSRLPSRVSSVLSAAAVSGRSFDLEVVAAACGLEADTFGSAVDDAARARLILEERDGRYRFAHALIQEALYQRIEPSLRPRMHARVAEAIERLWARSLDDQLPELVHHHANAGPAHSRATWTYATRAAARAAAQPAPAEAVRLYEVALASLDRDLVSTWPERYDLLVALMIASKRAGHEQAAWHTMRETATAALNEGDIVAAARAAVAITADSIWNWREYLIVDDQAVTLFDKLLSRLPAEHTDLRARLLATLATELYYRPSAADRAVTLSDESVAIVKATGSKHDLARVLELRHVVMERPHLLPERLATSAQLVALAEAASDPVAAARALVFRGRDNLEAGQWRHGLADYARARDLARANGIVPILVALAFADAVLLIAQGEFDTAEQATHQALALHRGTTLPGAHQLPAVLAATHHLARGTLDSIEPMLAEAARLDPSELFREMHALALLHAGRTDDARSVLGPWDRQVDLPPDFLWLSRMTIRATLWSRLAPPGTVQSLRTQLEPFAERIAIAGTGIAVLGYVSQSLGLLARASGDLDASVTHLTHALISNQNAGFRPFAASSADELAATLDHRARPGDAAQAVRHRTWARAEASTLGITLSRR